jgi:hypothetical protein
MTISIVATALLATIVGSELALSGTKLQTGLLRVLVVWGGVYVATMVVAGGNPGAVAFTIFWAGAFLSWFGVRSHIESSILLRMLVLLRQQPMTEARLVSEYASHYGESMRVEELCQGGLVFKDRDTLHVTPKGKVILRIVGKLR